MRKLKSEEADTYFMGQHYRDGDADWATKFVATAQTLTVAARKGIASGPFGLMCLLVPMSCVQRVEFTKMYNAACVTDDLKLAVTSDPWHVQQQIINIGLFSIAAPNDEHKNLLSLLIDTAQSALTPPAASSTSSISRRPNSSTSSIGLNLSAGLPDTPTAAPKPPKAGAAAAAAAGRASVTPDRPPVSDTPGRAPSNQPGLHAPAATGDAASASPSSARRPAAAAAAGAAGAGGAGDNVLFDDSDESSGHSDAGAMPMVLNASHRLVSSRATPAQAPAAAAAAATSSTAFAADDAMRADTSERVQAAAAACGPHTALDALSGA